MLNSLRLGDREGLLANSLGSGHSAGKSILVVDTLNTVSRVDVLDESNLEAGGTTLAGDDGGVGKEVFPDLQSLLVVKPEHR